MIGHIFIYGGIGTNPGEVSINNVKSQIDPKASEYCVHIISGGGDVFEGYGIYNLLKNTGKKVVTNIEGLCASIATLIAFAGDSIVMNKTAEFMIHNPSISDLTGDSADIRNVANQLDKIKTLLIDVSGQRALRNGKPITNEKLWALYDNETWLTAQEAQNMGFVDDVQEAIKAVAKVNLLNIKEMEKTQIEKLFSNVANMFKSLKFKNQVTDTLQDGRVIMIMTDAPDWTGAQVTLEDGSPLPAGDYPLASGKTITVDANYTITAVTDGTPANAENDMETKIKELEAKLAEALAANQTANAQVATAKAENAKFENRVKILEQDFLKAKEALEQTAGDTSDPGKGPVFKNSNNDAKYDPMGDFAADFYKSRKN